MKTALFDGLVNWVAGLGKPGTDKSTANTYLPFTHSREANESLYRASAFGRAALNIPAGDMTREWRTWLTKPEEMLAAEKSLKLPKLCKRGLIEGAKQGGAAVYIGLKGVDDETLQEPINLDLVKKGDLEYLTLFTRHELTVIEYEEDPLSPRYRKGRIYAINRGGHSSGLRIHWTRFAWFDGAETSSDVAETQDGWDDSRYTSLRPHVEAADSALANVLAMIHDARSDVLKIPNLASYFEDAESEAKLARRVMTTQHMKSTLHMMIIDGDEEHVSISQSFAGVLDVFKGTLEVLAGASDIPATRFLGTSPKGLNSTGESDLRNYYDSIAAQQNNDLSDSIRLLDDVLFRHVTGEKPDFINLSYKWKPLWQLSEKDSAEVAKKRAETSKIYHDLGLFDDEFLAAAILSQIKEDGLYPDLETLLEEMADEADAIDITAPVTTRGGTTDPNQTQEPS